MYDRSLQVRQHTSYVRQTPHLPPNHPAQDRHARAPNRSTLGMARADRLSRPAEPARLPEPGGCGPYCTGEGYGWQAAREGGKGGAANIWGSGVCEGGDGSESRADIE